MPAELMFLGNFYESQTLSSEKLIASSYGLVDGEITVFTELPQMIEYYLTRWGHLNLIEEYNESFYLPKTYGNDFIAAPRSVIELVQTKGAEILTDFSDLDG